MVKVRAAKALVAAAAEASVQPSSTVNEAVLIREAKAEALEEAASSPIPREALTNGTRTWLRACAAEHRKAVG